MIVNQAYNLLVDERTVTAVSMSNLCLVMKYMFMWKVRRCVHMSVAR
jgi:hypothetical protein